jgi:hypothetical protein
MENISDWISVIKSNDLEAIRISLTFTDPRIADNFAICWAAEFGHLDLLNLLLNDPRVDPSVENNYAFIDAVDNGHVAIVDRLLKDPRIDPSVDDHIGFCIAVQLGYYELVKLLLASPRIVLNAQTIEFAKRISKEKGYSAICSLFKKDTRFYSVLQRFLARF